MQDVQKACDEHGAREIQAICIRVGTICTCHFKLPATVFINEVGATNVVIVGGIFELEVGRPISLIVIILPELLLQWAFEDH